MLVGLTIFTFCMAIVVVMFVLEEFDQVKTDQGYTHKPGCDCLKCDPKDLPEPTL